ncbi:MAG: hypothetical protein IKZ98_13840 [Clostridia bacterium]|nr:hypothetical protein [Clostridia bacterium]
MRGKVIYRIACGTCSVCITYGLIMQAVQGENVARTAAEWAVSSAAVVAEAMPKPATVPTAEPVTIPFTEYGTENGQEYGGERGRKNRGQWSEESGGFGGRGGRGKHGSEGYGDYGNDQEVNYAQSFSEQKQETESASAQEEQDTGSTVQENRAADNPPSLNEFLSAFRCGGCRHNCSLLNPRCMKGRTKKQNATIQYQETYGG